MLVFGALLAVLWNSIQGGATAVGAVAPPALPPMKETFEQGVTLRFTQKGKTDARAARLLSLYVPAGEAPTPFLAPGAFEATWSGFLNLRLRGEYTFSVLGRGKVVLKVAGKPVLEADGEDFANKASAAIRMEKGRNPIEVVYAAPEQGDAWVRVLWSSRDFPPEPVQPASLSHDVSDKALREGTRLREGRELMANLRCGACHADEAAKRDAVPAMPELGRDAPDLSAAGARLKPAWMAAWISDPRALRPDATMPRIFHGAEGQTAAEANDLAAYLATLGKPGTDSGEAKEPEEEAIREGGQVFAALGCVGCHTKPDAEEVDKEHGRVPLKFVNAKFQPGALRAWLLNPHEHYKWARMPNFRLSDLEADRLVAYLSKHAKGEVTGDGKGDAEKGKALFTSAGCVACHQVGSAPQPAPQMGLAKSMAQLTASPDWTRGCVAQDDAARGKAPDFGLTDGQRDALRALAVAGVASLASDVPVEFAERSVRQLNCVACHARDEVEDRWGTLADEVADLMPPEHNVEGDQNAAEEAKTGPKLFVPRGLGKLHGGDELVVSGDQSRPALTWAGEKLRPEWAAKFIAGEVAYKPRYWMRARMPAYPVQASGIAHGLALGHGFPARPAAGAVEAKGAKAASPEVVEIGRKLSGRDGGFACVTCHSVGDMKAISAFEAPAPNFLHVTERLTHDYYLRWMRKPMRFQPGTKMPQFSEEGKSTLKEVLDGDADRQFEAMWEYMAQREKMAPTE